MADEPSLEELLAGRDRRAEDQATWDEFVSLFEAGGAGEVPAPADGGAGPVDERPGRPPSQAWDVTVDLHGCSRRDAADLLARRVREGRMRGIAVVRVVTGRGLHSTGGPVLAEWLPGWAAAHAPGAPLRCDRAPKEAGGAGAWLLFLGPR